MPLPSSQNTNIIPLSFYRIFSSHMVLQRGKAIVFAGRGVPLHQVQMQFAEERQTAQIDADGRWRVTFPAREAGGPFRAIASYADGKELLCLEDIMIGELWLCAGQSNMSMPVCDEGNIEHWSTKNAKEEAAAANWPMIRLYNAQLSHHHSHHAPMEDELLEIGWQVCTPESVKPFSACGYFFGRKLHQDLGIAIGLVDISWGGTTIESWLSKEALLANGFDVMPREDRTAPVSDEFWKKIIQQEALPAWVEKANAELGVPPKEWFLQDFDDTAWENCAGMHCFFYHCARYALRIQFELPQGMEPQPAATLRLGVINDVDKTYLNGEFLGETTIFQHGYYERERHYPIPAHGIHAGKNTLFILADNHYDYGFADCSELAIEQPDGSCIPLKATMRLTKWKQLPYTFMDRPDPPDPGVYGYQETDNYPCTMHNAKLCPWMKIPVGGMLWYQGCRNRGATSYYKLLRTFLEDIRAQWHDDELPILIVQLSCLYQTQFRNPPPAEAIDATPPQELASYAITREIQAEMPALYRRVGLVTTFDCGDYDDIHPRDKQTVGRRLAQKAEDMLGWIPQVSDGPEFIGYRYEHPGMRLFFRHAEGLHTTDGQPPRGFWAADCGNTGFFRPEVCIEGDTILLKSPQGIRLERARYAFCNYCAVNLVNGAGWPMLPFRTDKPDFRLLR